MQLSLWLPCVLGSIGPIIIPPAHIAVLWLYWQNYARYVDRRFCSCSCWDTVFKGMCVAQFSVNKTIKLNYVFLCNLGTYESGIASYKHMYFNATQNTLKIWILTVIAVIVFYECSKYLVKLTVTKSVRYSMIFLFCLSIFSHYYAWWAYVNYYNDDFYSQWNHQLFFTVSEFLLQFNLMLFLIRVVD